MVTAMKTMDCRICGVKFESEFRGLRNWRTWSLPDHFSNWRLCFSALNATIMWLMLIFLYVVFAEIIGPDENMRREYKLLDYMPWVVVFITVLHAFFNGLLVGLVIKLWVLENAAYEWKDRGQLHPK